MSKVNSKRVNIALPERTLSRLESLKSATDAASITEVMKHAIMTYESLAKHLSNGVVFSATKPSGETFEVEFMIDVPKNAEVHELKANNGMSAA